MSEILTPKEFERCVGSVGDPSWHLTEEYAKILLAHDAALRARVAELERERDVAYARIQAQQYDLDAATARAEAAEDSTQRFVEHSCHYRNLSILLGAKPSDMLDEYDRKLCMDGIGDRRDSLINSQEAWDVADAAEAESARLREAIRDAPHDEAECGRHVCMCWKSTALGEQP